MEWKDCIKDGSVTKSYVEDKKINLLINASKRKIDLLIFIMLIILIKRYYFLYYEGILELLHAFR